MLTWWARSLIALGVVACSNSGEDPAASTVRPMDGTDTPSSDGPNSDSPDCSDGDTRVCVGSGACEGGQRCEDGEWGGCDCGEGGGAEPETRTLSPDEPGSSDTVSPEDGEDTDSAGSGSTPTSVIGDAGRTSPEPEAEVGWAEVPLVADSTGWIDGSTNSLNIQGQWRFYRGEGCLADARPEGPDRSIYYNIQPDASGRFCFGGTWSMVACQLEAVSGETPPALRLGLEEPSEQTAIDMVYEAETTNLVGFAFDVEGSGPGFYGSAATAIARSYEEYYQILVLSPGEDVLLAWEQESELAARSEHWVGELASELWFLAYYNSEQPDAAFEMCVSNLRALVRLSP